MTIRFEESQTPDGYFTLSMTEGGGLRIDDFELSREEWRALVQIMRDHDKSQSQIRININTPIDPDFNYAEAIHNELAEALARQLEQMSLAEKRQWIIDSGYYARD